LGREITEPCAVAPDADPRKHTSEREQVFLGKAVRLTQYPTNFSLIGRGMILSYSKTALYFPLRNDLGTR
jgi:hypothetical protein